MERYQTKIKNKFKFVFDIIPNKMHCWISGGCFCDYLINNKINDIDLYFTTISDLETVVNFLYKQKFYLYKKVCCYRLEYYTYNIDLIYLDFKNDIIKCIKSHDFSTNCIALDNKFNLYYHNNFMSDIENNILRIININTNKRRVLNYKIYKKLNNVIYDLNNFNITKIKINNIFKYI